MVNSFNFPQPALRQTEIENVSALLRQDQDLVITGVPGIGRRTLIRAAAHQAGIIHLEINCLHCHSAKHFVQLLTGSISTVFSKSNQLTQIQQWILAQSQLLQKSLSIQDRLVCSVEPGKEWLLFEQILPLLQYLAESTACRIVIVFHNLAHIRTWDRHRKWETRLLREIQHQEQVSYALIAIVPESWMDDMNLPTLSLEPLSEQSMRSWAVNTMAAAKLRFDPDGQSLETFLSYVQGHIKDAAALAQRIQLMCCTSQTQTLGRVIQTHYIHSSMLALVRDVEVTFETLLLLLPSTQTKLLESLALDPTNQPQSTAYIKKHGLSRGGSLQGALSSLEQKGLIYGPKLGYRVSLPLLDFWLKHGAESQKSRS